MKRTLRSALAAGLAVLLGAPLSAQQTTTRLPQPEHAAKGDYVEVTLRDGREIRGQVGKWVDDVGFRVKPSDSAAYLIHPEDVVSIRAAASGRELLLPQRKEPGKVMSTANAITLGVFATLGGLFLLARFIPAGG